MKTKKMINESTQRRMAALAGIRLLTESEDFDMETDDDEMTGGFGGPPTDGPPAPVGADLGGMGGGDDEFDDLDDVGDDFGGDDFGDDDFGGGGDLGGFGDGDDGGETVSVSRSELEQMRSLIDGLLGGGGGGADIDLTGDMGDDDLDGDLEDDMGGLEDDMGGFEDDLEEEEILPESKRKPGKLVESLTNRVYDRLLKESLNRKKK